MQVKWESMKKYGVEDRHQQKARIEMVQREVLQTGGSLNMLLRFLGLIAVPWKELQLSSVEVP